MFLFIGFMYFIISPFSYLLFPKLFQYILLESTETRNAGVAVKLSKKFPILTLNSITYQCRDIFSMRFAAIPSFSTF